MNSVNINGRISKVITTDAQKAAGVVEHFIISTKRFGSAEWDDCFCAMDKKKWDSFGLSEGVIGDFKGALKSERSYVDKDDNVVKDVKVGADGRLTDGKGNFYDKRVVRSITKMFVSIDDVKLVSVEDLRTRVAQAKEILSGSVSF